MVRSVLFKALGRVGCEFRLERVEVAFETALELADLTGLFHRNQPEITSWLLTVLANI